jgi:hypothetical protein
VVKRHGQPRSSDERRGAAAENSAVKPRITAVAGLALAVAALAFVNLVLGPTGGQASVAHTCYPVDRQFIVSAQLNMAALEDTADQYLRGQAKSGEVIQGTKDAMRSLANTRPADPSLTRTKLLLHAMFLEYQKAVRATEHHKSAGRHIYRAYGLANFAHDLLVHEQKPLAAQGCDVTSLL